LWQTHLVIQKEKTNIFENNKFFHSRVFRFLENLKEFNLLADRTLEINCFNSVSVG